MRIIISIILAVAGMATAGASKYSYTFSNTPLSEAIIRISKDNPDVNISFIYKELDNYRTSSRINTDNTYDALRMAIGINPVSVVEKNGDFYIEALQHGKYRYSGQAIGSDREPVAAATVMLLSPKDSTVITYGITDRNGRFSIPCDSEHVLGKFSCLGYKTVYN